MREAYYEESASCLRANREAKIYSVLKVVAIVLFVCACVVVSFVGVYFTNLWAVTVMEDGTAVWSTRILGIVSYIMTVIFFVALGLFFWFMKNRFNQSFDYLFVEDELRVSKVFNGKKRKFLKTFKADQILKMGRCEADSFERTCAGLGKKQIRFYTPNRTPADGKEFFYVLYSTSVEKAVYIIETKKEMMDYLVFAAGRSKWEAK